LDLVVYNPTNSSHSQLGLDVAVTDPIPGAKTGLLHINNKQMAIEENRANKVRYNEKVNKYKNDAVTVDMGLQPIVFESTGRIHPDSGKYIAQLAKTASDVKKIPHSVRYNYFMKRLSAVLQRGIAKCILLRVMSVNSHTNLGYTDPSFDPDLMTDR